MKDNYMHIVAVLDSSGSMAGIYDDTVKGFNHFLKGQKEAEGHATMSLFAFGLTGFVGQPVWGGQVVNGIWTIPRDQTFIPQNVVPIHVINEFSDIKDIKELSSANYRTFGGTPLLDTIGEAIRRTGVSLAAMPEDQRPSKVLFVIITDGEENSSKVYSHQMIKDWTKHQTDVYKWEYIYLGANQDAIRVGETMGFVGTRSMTYSTGKISETFDTLTSKTSTYRGMAGGAAASASLDFTNDERIKSSGGSGEIK